MMRSLILFFMLTVMALATEKVAISPYVAIAGLVALIGLFFWGIYKAIRTQKLIYALALLPFTILLFWMFFI